MGKWSLTNFEVACTLTFWPKYQKMECWSKLAARLTYRSIVGRGWDCLVVGVLPVALYVLVTSYLVTECIFVGKLFEILTRPVWINMWGKSSNNLVQVVSHWYPAYSCVSRSSNPLSETQFAWLDVKVHSTIVLKRAFFESCFCPLTMGYRYNSFPTLRN